jgi:hypothetical protein
MLVICAEADVVRRKRRIVTVRIDSFLLLASGRSKRAIVLATKRHIRPGASLRGWRNPHIIPRHAS